MKKIAFCFAALLLGSSLAFGYGPENNNAAVYDSAEQVVVPQHTLTPKRPPTVVMRAQQSIAQPTMPDPYIPPTSEPMLLAETPPRVERVAFAEPAAPANNGSDAYAHIYSELEHLSSELQKIKKDTAKPDTKKGWSSPKIGGRIFIDSVNFADQKGSNLQNRTGFRELRLGASGNGYDCFDYKVEFGFQKSGGLVVLVDNWIGAKNVPLLGYFRVGHFKPETGLYYPMGTTNISLMEYTTAANVFGLKRKIGISSEHLFAGDRVRLFFGVFQNVDTEAAKYLEEDNQGQIVNLRLTAAPLFAQEGKRVLHLGGHWEYASTDAKKASLNATPGTFDLKDKTLVETDFANDYSNRGGLEFAYQNGRFSTRAEVFAGSFDVYGSQPGRHLYGAYVEAAYFLTNDFRTYDLKSGAFGGVKMKNNFHPFKCGEWNLVDSFGAWQAVFQWSYVDMDDWRNVSTATAAAGRQNDFIAGLNWFWTPQLRWIFEYVRSEQCVGSNYVHRSQDIFATSLRVNW